MIYLLHIDTSDDNGLVALAADGKVLAAQTITDSRNQAAVLNILIDTVLKDADVTLEQLSAVVSCAGPGSYTGLRIGVATAKGLCYALDKPLLLDNKLTLLAYQQYYKKNDEYDVFLSLLKARENEFFVAGYTKNFEECIAPQHIHATELEKLITITDTKTLLSGEIDDDIKNLFKIKIPSIFHSKLIDKGVWAMYAYEQYKCNRFVTLSAAEPFYLKQVYTHKSKAVN